MSPLQLYRVNLGGEGEAAGALDQQGRWVLQPGWSSSRGTMTLVQLAAAGHDFLICDNLTITLPDNCADQVFTNRVPVDTTTWLGPGVQSTEIQRIPKSGGMWFLNGNLHYTKP